MYTRLSGLSQGKSAQRGGIVRFSVLAKDHEKR